MNYFLIANTILTFSAGIWYIANDQKLLGCLQLTFTVSNILFILIGLK